MDRYYSFNKYLRETFGCKIYKLALDGGMTCPNRDGTLGNRGCIFCSDGGSGDFAERQCENVERQIENAKSRVKNKITNGKYIAYFQSYTNTYASVEYLQNLFFDAIKHPDIAALSVGTRPDCLPEDVVKLLSELNEIKPVFVELGLQTIHENTAKFIRRGYPLSVFDEAVNKLKSANVNVVVHLIIGLPGETRTMMLESADYVAKSGVNGVKLQLLHVLKGTDLAEIYERGEFRCLNLNEYVEIIGDCISRLPPNMVIHRLTGDAPKRILIAPQWSADKKKVLNAIDKSLTIRNIVQGDSFLK